MDRYIGLDVHTQSCTLALMSSQGKHLREQVIETNGEALVRCIEGIAGTLHVCLEEGTQSEWLYEVLSPHAAEVIVVQSPSSRGNKSDSLDAWGLAERARTQGQKGCVYKAPSRFAALREAVRGHQMATNDLVRAKNRLKAQYRSRGLHGMGDAIYDPARRADWLKKLPPAKRRLSEHLSEHLDAMVRSHEQAERWLLEQARAIPEVARLQTAPGLGPIRAAKVVAIVVTPERFRTRQQFWSYSGLAVTSRSSADWEKDGSGRWSRRGGATTRGLNRNRQPVLKAAFKGAAMTILTKMPEHPLHAAYQARVAAGIKPHLARLTLARSIASAVLAMWKKKEEYRPEKHRTQDAA